MYNHKKKQIIIQTCTMDVQYIWLYTFYFIVTETKKNKRNIKIWFGIWETYNYRKGE